MSLWLASLATAEGLSVVSIIGNEATDQTDVDQPAPVRPDGPHVAVALAFDDGYNLPAEARRVDGGSPQVAVAQSREVRLRLVSFGIGADRLLRVARLAMARRTGPTQTMRDAGVVPWRMTALVDESALLDTAIERRMACDLWCYVDDSVEWTNVSPADTITVTTSLRDDDGNTVAPDATFSEST